MIRSRFLTCALVLAAGCNAASALTEEPLQGIVEHDERVIGFSVGGRVLEVLVHRGDLVAPDQPLIRLDDSLERPVRAARAAEVEASEAQLRLVQAGPRAEEIRAAATELESLRAQAALAADRLARQRRLVEQGAIPSAALDEIESVSQSLDGRADVLEERLRGLRRGARTDEVEAVEARLRAAEAALEASQTRLSHHEIKSPGHFTVTDVHAAAGEIAGPGSAGVTVADLDHPFVDVFVPERRMASVRLGQRAMVRIDGVRDALPATIEYVSNRTEFTPRFLFSESERPNLVLRVRVRIEDAQHRLRAGIPAFVTLVATESGAR